MKLGMFQYFILMIVASFLASCSTVSGMMEKDDLVYEIKLEQDAELLDPNEGRVTLKKGETYTAKNFPLLIQAPGHTSLMLLGKTEAKKEVSVKLKKLGKWAGKDLLQENNQILNELISEINSVQFLLASQNNQTAYEKLKVLQKKYPDLSYLKFLEASVLTVMGKRLQAAVALEGALQDFPNHPRGLKLYESLTGRAFQSKATNTRIPASKEKKE